MTKVAYSYSSKSLDITFRIFLSVLDSFALTQAVCLRQGSMHRSKKLMVHVVRVLYFIF